MYIHKHTYKKIPSIYKDKIKIQNKCIFDFDYKSPKGVVLTQVMTIKKLYLLIYDCGLVR